MLPEKYSSNSLFSGLSYGQVNEKVEALATQLRPKSKLALVAEHRPETLLFILAAMRAEITLALLSPRNTKVEEKECLQDLSQQEAQRAKAGGIEYYSLEGGSFGAALVLFTSGTSSRAKALVHPLANFWNSATAHNQVTGLNSGDVWGLSLPLNHAGGLAILFRVIQAGAALEFPSEPNAAGISKIVSKVNYLSLVPTVFSEITADLSKQKLILLGGAAVPKSIERTGLPVAVSYGMTEVCSTILIAKDNEQQILPHVRVSIVDDEGQELPKGQVGRIQIESSCLYSGELKAGEYVPRNSLPAEDRGFIDNGLHILGRGEDVIISGGENISALEIESTAQEYKSVEDAFVLAVNDEKWGQRPALFLQVGQGYKEESFLKHLGERLSSFKMPKHIVAVDSFPRTELGKVSAMKLRKLLP